MEKMQFLRWNPCVESSRKQSKVKVIQSVLLFSYSVCGCCYRPIVKCRKFVCWWKKIGFVTWRQRYSSSSSSFIRCFFYIFLKYVLLCDYSRSFSSIFLGRFIKFLIIFCFWKWYTNSCDDMFHIIQIFFTTPFDNFFNSYITKNLLGSNHLKFDQLSYT